MPIRYHGVTVQSRRRRGRPSGKGTEYGDVGEANARARIALEEGYKPPKVRNGHAIYFCLFAVKFRFYYAGYIPSARSGFGRRRHPRALARVRAPACDEEDARDEHEEDAPSQRTSSQRKRRNRRNGSQTEVREAIGIRLANGKKESS